MLKRGLLGSRFWLNTNSFFVLLCYFYFFVFFVFRYAFHVFYIFVCKYYLCVLYMYSLFFRFYSLAFVVFRNGLSISIYLGFIGFILSIKILNIKGDETQCITNMNIMLLNIHIRIGIIMAGDYIQYSHSWNEWTKYEEWWWMLDFRFVHIANKFGCAVCLDTFFY